MNVRTERVILVPPGAHERWTGRDGVVHWFRLFSRDDMGIYRPHISMCFALWPREPMTRCDFAPTCLWCVAWHTRDPWPSNYVRNLWTELPEWSVDPDLKRLSRGPVPGLALSRWIPYGCWGEDLTCRCKCGGCTPRVEQGERYVHCRNAYSREIRLLRPTGALHG